MPAGIYIAWGANVSALTAPPAFIAVAASTQKTVLQLRANANIPFRLRQWGYILDAIPSVLPKIEVIDTGTVGATMTSALATADLRAWNVPTGSASQILSGGSGASVTTGFNGSAEGTITSNRLLMISCEPSAGLHMQFPYGVDPEIAANNFVRMRVTTGASGAINIMPYFLYEE